MQRPQSVGEALVLEALPAEFGKAQLTPCLHLLTAVEATISEGCPDYFAVRSFAKSEVGAAQQDDLGAKVVPLPQPQVLRQDVGCPEGMRARRSPLQRIFDADPLGGQLGYPLSIEVR